MPATKTHEPSKRQLSIARKNQLELDFDYAKAGIEGGDKEDLERIADRVLKIGHDTRRTAVRNLLTIADDIADSHAIFGEATGNWKQWTTERLGYSTSTAQKALRIHNRLSDYGKQALDNCDVGVLNYLSNESVTDKKVDQVMGCAKEFEIDLATCKLLCGDTSNTTQKTIEQAKVSSFEEGVAYIRKKLRPTENWDDDLKSEVPSMLRAIADERNGDES